MGITQRYFIYLSYNGKKYHGWQIQQNACSVQGLLEESFSKVLGEPIALTGAGRTDTGVHAKLMIAHCNIEKPIDDPISFVGKFNNFLPRDIVIHKIIPVHADAHARYDALSRTYEYHIISKKNPFLTDFAFQYKGQLDVEKMNEAAACLFDYTDFTSFSKLHTDAKTNNCTIMQAVWEQKGEILVFTIQANRFLRNMVRAIVGTLMEVGKGRISIEEFKAIIETKNRCAAGVSMPGQALYLMDVTYPENIFLAKQT